MFRSVANKNGTIEVNGNTFRFSQPADEYKTEDTTRIEESYSKQMDYIADDPHYITAQEIESRNGQIILEFDLTDLKMFDYLRTLFFEEKIYYFQSLLEIAKRDESDDVNVLWQKENFVVDPQETTMKCMVIEHNEFKLHDQKNTVAAVKELIILSLTSMNRVLGKPRRADFLEQNDDVIYFAEKIYLRAKTIEEIEDYINSEIYRIEMRKKEEESEPKQGKLAVLREKIDSKTSVKTKDRESVISKLKNNNNDEEKSKAKNTKNDKKTLIWTFGAVAGAIVLSLALTTANDKQESSANAKEKEQVETEQMVSVYRDSFFEEPSETIAKMEEIGYKNLSDDDKNVLNHLYVQTGSYEKAIENDSSKAGEIARTMHQKEEFEQLSEFVSGLEKENKEATFYLADANQDWDQILGIKDNMKLNNEQLNIVLTAFFKKEDVAGAEEFLETVKKPTDKMQERVNTAKSAQEKVSKAEKELADLKKKLDDEDDKDKKKDLEKKVNKAKDNVNAAKNDIKSA
ncbi:hypothetical protein [Virgibacillus salexigens]|uniref:Type VII secretion protein EssB n=1 Tax=Virgibacillus kapii TaxID=1638645 RepID=A0ABQ2DYC0_9BACI|nr:hypothetical protein [Virgibacillus kapii]GGJ77405.1 hypothetical protein GCM10007111_43760 [Virgibacillus kapii]